MFFNYLVVYDDADDDDDDDYCYLLSIYLKLFGSGPENEPKDAFVKDAGPQSDSEVDK